MRALPAGAGGVNRVCFQSPADCGCSLDQCDYHRGRRSLRGAMEDGFDVVPVEINEVGAVLPGMVDTRTWRPVAKASRRQTHFIKPLNALRTVSLEGQVHPRLGF